MLRTSQGDREHDDMEGIYERTAIVLGEDGVEKLKASRVAVFGVGGVGGYVCEALVRAGVGHILIVDNDTVSESNLNRQIIALHSNIGRPKTECMLERLKDINPEVDVEARNMFFLPGNADEIDLAGYDHVVDAVDTVSAKIELAVRCDRLGVRLISSMGTGAKLHPELFQIADIYDTSECPLAKVMRKELRKRGIGSLKVLYSKEVPITNDRPPGSVSFVPSVAGLMIAGEVIRVITECDRR